MAYVGRDFSPISPNEWEDKSFDFGNEVSDPCDVITSATWSISVDSGSDASVATRLSGSPNNCDLVTTQRIAQPVDGVRYKVTALATMQSGQKLELYSYFFGKT